LTERRAPNNALPSTITGCPGIGVTNGPAALGDGASQIAKSLVTAKSQTVMRTVARSCARSTLALRQDSKSAAKPDDIVDG
jgi:hypothetical protein